jgi:hypothetical protein
VPARARSFLMQPLIERNLNEWILPLVSGNVVQTAFTAKVNARATWVFSQSSKT